MSQKLLNILRTREWMHRNRLECAQVENEVAHSKGTVCPNSQEQLWQYKDSWLAVQVELERAECEEAANKTETKRGG